MREIDEFASRHLAGRRVAVVCDSDWDTNELVLQQTMQVVDTLVAHGANAVACAPPEGEPLGWNRPVRRRNLAGEGGVLDVEVRAKRGVDDWLGARPRRERHDALLGPVCRVEDSGPALSADDPRLKGIRRDGRQTIVDVVLELGCRAFPGTQVAPFQKEKIMGALDRPKQPVEAAIGHAIARGLVSELSPARRRPGNRMEAPLFEITPEALPTIKQPTLGDWLG